MSREHPRQALLDEGLGVHVERRERVVEDEDRRPGDDGTGEGEPLPLAARERQALLSDAGVEPPGKVVHEPAWASSSAARMSSSWRRAARGARFSRTLIEKSTGSSKAIGHLAAQRLEGDVPDVDARRG